MSKTKKELENKIITDARQYAKEHYSDCWDPSINYEAQKYFIEGVKYILKKYIVTAMK